MESYNTHPNPYKKYLSSEEVLQKRLDNVEKNWRKYVKIFLILHALFLLFLFTVITTIKLALIIF